MGWMGRDTVITQMVGIFSGVNHSGAVFNSEKSFFSQIESTYIVLFVEDNNPASLFIIPSTFKSIIVLSADEYGDLITRLLNIVNNKFPSADKFIDDYLGGEYD